MPQYSLGQIYMYKHATVYCFLPDGYWFVEKNALAVTYPTYEFNVINYQKERNCGAGVHDLLSVAFAAES